MAQSVAAPSYLAPHITSYKERVRRATPVGNVVNDQWLSATMAFCDHDAKGARELAAKSLRTFFGPDRPYLKDMAGDPDDCLRSIAIHEEAGVDELQFLMATETVPHATVMESIEMFGKHVIPELKRRSR